MSNLFPNSYQGGVSFEVFSAQGANPTANWKIMPYASAIKKVLDKGIKGNIFVLEGGANVFMQLPSDEKKVSRTFICFPKHTFTCLVSLLQPYLVLQVLIPRGQPFSVEFR